VRVPSELSAAFALVTKQRADALILLGSPMFFVNRSTIADLAAKSRLPSISHFSQYAEAGALMAYGPSLRSNYRRAAWYVDQILKGAKPADLAVEQPTKFELVINLKTAKALGIAFPASILARADQTIE
jgi:putative ABC transport system substrate-binding protein